MGEENLIFGLIMFKPKGSVSRVWNSLAVIQLDRAQYEEEPLTAGKTWRYKSEVGQAYLL